MHLAYQLGVRNGIKNLFYKEIKRMKGSGSKVSYVVIKKFQLQPLKFFTLKSEGFHSCLSWSVFLNLRNRKVHHSTQYCKILQMRRNRHHYCAAQKHKNIGQTSDIFCSFRRTGITCDSRHLYESNWTLHFSVTPIFKKIYETRTEEWHTAWINPLVPSLGVDTERDFQPVVSSLHQTYEVDKIISLYFGIGRAVFTNKKQRGHFSSKESY